MTPQGLRQRYNGQPDVSVDPQTRLPLSIRPAQILRADVDLDEFHSRVKLRRHAKRQDPVQTRTEQENNIGAVEGGAAGGGGVQWTRVGHDAFAHGRGEEREVGGGDKLADGVLGPGVGGAFAEDDEGGARGSEERRGGGD